MKILLISFNQQDVKEFKESPTDISTLGIRYLSSYLKAAGHEVDILFLCKYFRDRESEDEIKQIIEFIRSGQYGLIGLGLMSNHFFRAVAVTQAIKKEFPQLPVIWGGIHPTIKPRECLEYADMICVGEGELAFEKLVANFDNYKNIKIDGIWHKEGNEIIEGGHGQLICDINTIPHPDYDLSTQYIIHEGVLQVFTNNIFRQYYPASHGDHRLLSSRGCPHACSYCCSSVYRNIYGGSYMRRRTVDDFILEMQEIKNKFSFVQYFKIMDDSFTSNSIEWIREFSRQYKEKINCPFFCFVSPLTIDEEKLNILLDCGLDKMQIGLQSGSDRINHDIYLRYVRSKDFLNVMKLFEKYHHRLNLTIDTIVDNPFEREEDKLQTIRILNEVKRPFTLALYSLAVYPGTNLYEQVMNDKLLSNKDEYLDKQFHLLKRNSLNRITYLTARMPKSTIEWLLDNRHRLIIHSYINFLYFIFMHKNNMPASIISLASKIKKKINRNTQ